MRPLKVPDHIIQFIDGRFTRDEMEANTRKLYQMLHSLNPEVSIVMPAYNEEENIVATLASLAANKTHRGIEIIVVDNNSKDLTKQLVQSCGIPVVSETRQGITFARNRGLSTAVGKYVLNADADTIYPPDWIEEMVRPLESEKVTLTYGRFAFIPVGSTTRGVYFFYEYIAQVSRWINKLVKDEAVNVYGFNSGFKREQCLTVDGFNHPEGTNEDGWLALKLRNKGFGELHQVTGNPALVWTTDRRLQIDGGLVKATVKRLKRMLNLS